MDDLFKAPRNSSMMLNEVYFWTSSVKDWKHLLKPDKYKNLIIDTWKSLVDKNLLSIYGFVIMPNHLHVLWEHKSLNGKEMPHASFNKATAHEIRKDLLKHHPKVLDYFKVSDRDRSYRIWQRDPLAVLMDSKWKFEQKLEYIHNNPLTEKWNLAKRPEDYKWSSASFYEDEVDPFGLLTHYHEYFG
jgi:putative transposase